MIGSDIISSLGAGSGIGGASIAEQLTELERAPKQDAIDTKRDKFETQLSDFGILRSALATLQDSANLLGDSDTFNSKTASFNDSTALIPEELDETAASGDYTFAVSALATSHSLAVGDANAFTEQTSTIGKGTLSFSFGDWAGDFKTFDTTDTDTSSVTITIDDSNNSLLGLKDLINEKVEGVQASLVDDGVNGFKLVLKGPSGENNEMKIVAVEEGTSEGDAANIDATGLSIFSFVEDTDDNIADGQLTQLTAGQDAAFTVNGLAVTRSTNQIEDVVEGFKFTLSDDSADPFTINITRDTAVAEDAVRGFVETFNAFMETVAPLTGFNEAEEDGEEDFYGSLHREPTSRAMLASLRSAISNSVDAVTGGFSSLTNVGIRTNLDGTLEINEDDFRKAFDDNYELVTELFSPKTSSSADKISVTSFGEQTIPGSYDVVISQDPEQGSLTGVAVANDPLGNLSTPTAGSLVATTAGSLFADLGGTLGGVAGNSTTLATLLDDLSGTQASVSGTDPSAMPLDFTVSDPALYALDITIGAATNTIQLDAASYADQDAVAAAWQGKIDTAFGAGLATITYDAALNAGAGGFTLVDEARGSSSNILVAAAAGATNAADTGLVGASDTGIAPAGVYTFDIAVDGAATEAITIATDEGNLSSYADLAAHLQTQINAQQTGTDITVAVNGGGDGFDISSGTGGAVGTSSVVISNSSAGALALGLDTTQGVTETSGAAPAADAYDFDLEIDGTTYSVDMDGLYGAINSASTNTDFEVALDAAIEAAVGGGDNVAVSYSGGSLTITSNTNGAASSVTYAGNGGANIADLGLDTAVETTGALGSGDYDFTVRVNGTDSGTISLVAGAYADNDALAAHIQAQINTDQTLSDAGAEVTVVWDTDHFVIQSDSYGSKSTVSVTAVGADAADLGLAAGASSSGKDTVGTVDGVTGFGVGNVLLPKLDSDPYGLTFLIAPGAASSTINFSRGFGGELSQLIDSYLESGGVFADREESLNVKLGKLDDDEDALDRRIDAFHERMMAQFQAMERIINGLNQSGTMLDGIVDRLPFTAQQG